MGDYFQIIVDRDVTEADAAPLAARVVGWLVAEGVIGPERTEPVLGKGPGYPPGPRIREVVDSSGWGEPWQGGPLDVEVTRTRFDAGQWADPASAGCPRCERDTEFHDETWEEIPGAWDPFSEAFTDWEEGGEGFVRCAHCDASSPLVDWTGMGGCFSFGNLGFTFWGWPDLTPAFLAEFDRRLGGHRTAFVSGKL
ncbi:hypothetical protein [Streptomyces anulatus]|uniref:hypothetical protein n=1 Tax=Streptomyces anulatus TaxID=1892 RepID=UPI003862D983|nr:hypothetical protein OG865_16305 [Streptomyces anulatus]